MSDYRFDVVIIGSGIGGLTCGNYLAKAGLRVAIFEKNPRPGGCCVSFKRGGYFFDAGPHAIGDLGAGGIFKKIIEELNIDNKVRFIRPNPCEKIIFPEFNFTMESDINGTKEQIQKIFPKEADNTERFFDFIRKADLLKLYPLLYNKDFSYIIDGYFHGRQIKKVFYSLIGPAGTLPSNISALSAVIFYKQWVFDGGYYPLGGMQNLSNAFMDNFINLGGKIYLNSLVKNIIINNNRVEGITLACGARVKSNHVVSNADATLTLSKLVGQDRLPKPFVNRLSKMVPGFSVFFVFLGLKNNLKKLGMPCRLWYMYNINNQSNNKSMEDDDYLILISSSLSDPALMNSGTDSLTLMKFVSFKSKDYWENNKLAIADKYIRKVEDILPGLSREIVSKDIATPYTYQKFTLNHKGAVGGWSLIPSQSGDSRLNAFTPIENLYLAGHWTRPGIGINNASRSGAFIAKQIIKDLKR